MHKLWKMHSTVSAEQYWTCSWQTEMGQELHTLYGLHLWMPKQSNRLQA